MAKDKKTFSRMTWVGPIMYNVLAIPIVTVSMVGTSLYKAKLQGLRTDMLVPMMTAEWSNIVLTVLMLWVLFAFATSTANAFMLTAMTIISHDFAARFVFNKIADEKERDVKVVRFSKNACIIVVFACIAVALMKLTYIIDYAYNLATPGFSQLIIPMIFGLYWRRASKEAAIASSVVGICVLIWAQIINPSPLGYHPILWSGAANVITFYLVTIFTKPPQEVVDAFFPPEDVVI